MRTFLRHIFFSVSAAVAAAVVFAGCSSLDAEKQYEATLRTLSVKAVYPAGYTDYERAGIDITVVNNTDGSTYIEQTDENASARFVVSEGFYNISLSDIQGRHIFNGASDQVRVTGGDLSIDLQLIESTTSAIVIKEIYCGGCTKYPEIGTYASDKYIILHNNSDETYYLDGLCFGVLDPYNSSGTNVWVSKNPATGESVFPDFMPVGECVWQFGGGGEDFPLAAGEDAVIAINGAIDHTLQYYNSVNLNDERYFVCYDPVLYYHPMYHPVPGDKIKPSHYLKVVTKVGPSSGYPFSQTSPAVVIFRAQDCDINDYVLSDGAIMQKPGSTVISIVKIPIPWIVDAVEVYDGTSSNNRKRFPPSLDAGYVYQSDTYLGRSLHRRLDEKESAATGLEIYCDTNNSTNDFYERERPSLKDNE